MDPKEAAEISEVSKSPRLFSLRSDLPGMLIELKTRYIVEHNHILQAWFGQHGELPPGPGRSFHDYLPRWVQAHDEKEAYATEIGGTRDVFSSRGSAIWLPGAAVEIPCKITTTINEDKTLVLVHFVDLSEQSEALREKEAEIEAQIVELDRYRLDAETSQERLKSAFRSVRDQLLTVGAIVLLAFVVAVVSLAARLDASIQEQALGIFKDVALVVAGGVVTTFTRGKDG